MFVNKYLRYFEVAVCSARRSKDFKMTKSLMLCVVTLTFLCLGSSKHMEFKNCGKLSFQLRFHAIFVPMYVTPCTRIVHEVEWLNRGVLKSGYTFVCCQSAKILRKTENRFQAYDNHCFFTSVIKSCLSVGHRNSCVVKRSFIVQCQARNFTEL